MKIIFLNIKIEVFIKLKISVIKSRRLRWISHVGRMEEGRITFKIFTGKSTWKRPLGRPRRKWEDNIKMNLK